MAIGVRAAVALGLAESPDSHPLAVEIVRADRGVAGLKSRRPCALHAHGICGTALGRIHADARRLQVKLGHVRGRRNDLWDDDFLQATPGIPPLRAHDAEDAITGLRQPRDAYERGRSTVAPQSMPAPTRAGPTGMPGATGRSRA